MRPTLFMQPRPSQLNFRSPALNTAPRFGFEIKNVIQDDPQMTQILDDLVGKVTQGQFEYLGPLEAPPREPNRTGSKIRIADANGNPLVLYITPGKEGAVNNLFINTYTNNTPGRYHIARSTLWYDEFRMWEQGENKLIKTRVLLDTISEQDIKRVEDLMDDDSFVSWAPTQRIESTHPDILAKFQQLFRALKDKGLIP